MPRDGLIAAGGFTAWLTIGVPIAIRGANSEWTLAGWVVSFVAFGISFGAAMSSRMRGPRLSRRFSLLAIGAQAGAVIAMVLLLCNGFEGMLLVLVAMQLPELIERCGGIGWVVGQSALFAGAIALHWSPSSALLLAPPYFGFQLLALFAFEGLVRETRTNAELRALQEILVESNRLAERLRLKAEIHDALGHHLTALALNLEAALQRAEGEARQRIEAARSIVKQLLGEVRDIVSAMSAGPGIDLKRALTALVEPIPRPQVHLSIAAEVRLPDPERAHVLMRCVQEIVTNAAKHSGAENLWITIDHDASGVAMRARDDGRGSGEVTYGVGLSAMRERIERAGGALTIATRPGVGFDVLAVLPARSRVP